VDISFVINQPVSLEETLYCEFKEVKGTKPVKTIANTVDEYVVAFLNAQGGSIYWGIRDLDRVVVGVPLTFSQRDELRKMVMGKLTQIQPAIAPTAYQMHLHTIYRNAQIQESIADVSIVEVVAPRVDGDDLYFTGGNEAFVKTPAGKKKLSGPELQDEIGRRLHRKRDVAKADDRTELLDRWGFSAVLNRAKLVAPVLKGAEILWVDDNPGNNIYERMMFKSLGIAVDVAISTDEALAMLSMCHYDAVVSDMSRHGNAQAGLELLYAIQEQGWHTKTVFYISKVDRNRGVPPGSFGLTTYTEEMIHLVLDVLERERTGR
jgi:CheY-like chemotaxis protein